MIANNPTLDVMTEIHEHNTGLKIRVWSSFYCFDLSHFSQINYSTCLCPKILYIRVSDKGTYANNADLDQLLLKEQSDQFFCLPFY